MNSSDSLVVDSFDYVNYSCSGVSEFKTFMNIAGYAILNFSFANSEMIVYDVAIDPFELIIHSPSDDACDVENVSSISYYVSSGESCWYSLDAGSTNSSFVSAGTSFSGLNLGD